MTYNFTNHVTHLNIRVPSSILAVFFSLTLLSLKEGGLLYKCVIMGATAYLALTVIIIGV